MATLTGEGFLALGGAAGEDDPAQAKTQKKASKKHDIWIPKARLEYLPWARYCVEHQESEERKRETA